MSDSENHEGPVSALRYAADRVAVLCSRGHVIATLAAGEWPHSIWESRVSSGFYAVCTGRVE